MNGNNVDGHICCPWVDVEENSFGHPATITMKSLKDLISKVNVFIHLVMLANYNLLITNASSLLKNIIN